MEGKEKNRFFESRPLVLLLLQSPQETVFLWQMTGNLLIKTK